MGMYRQSFSDIRFDIKQQVAEGDFVCTLLEAQGDDTGGLRGQAPTGRHARIMLTITDRLADGKIAESWATWDTLGMLQQLGLVPTPAQQPAASA